MGRGETPLRPATGADSSDQRWRSSALITGPSPVVAPKGDLERAGAEALRLTLAGLVDGGRVRLVVDLGRVHYIDSGGLAALVAGMKLARAAGGDLRVCHLQPDIRVIFELTRLITVLTAHPTRHEALAACA